ncbi:MAG: zinc-binding dehydrogenase [Elusimicrobiota bacterium]
MSGGTMQAVIYHGPRDIRLERVPIPTPGPGEVLLRVGAALTCGTDFKAYRQGHRVLLGDGPSPFGHELAGTVEESGPGAERFPAGMRVVAANSAPCDACFFCGKGQPQLCDGLKLHNGAYAQYSLLPGNIVRRNLYEVPAGLELRDAALCEPLACAVHAADAMGVRAGESVAVLGGGVMAMLLTETLKARQARVLVVGRGEPGLERALEAGAERAASSLQTDPGQAARDFTSGRGADCVFEAVGTPETWQAAFSMTRKGGRVCLFGGCAQGALVPVDAHRVHYEQLSLQGVFHHTPRHFAEALALIAGRTVNARRYVASSIPLSEVPDYFKRMQDRSALKVAVIP